MKTDPLGDPEQRWVDARRLADEICVRWGDSFNDGERLRLSRSAVEDADKLLRLGPLGVDPKPVPLDKALNLVAFMHERMGDRPGRGRPFSWARVVQSAGNLREHYVEIRAEAKAIHEAARAGVSSRLGRETPAETDARRRLVAEQEAAGVREALARRGGVAAVPDDGVIDAESWEEDGVRYVPDGLVGRRTA